MHRFAVILQLLFAVSVLVPSRAQDCSTLIDDFAACMKKKLITAKGENVDVKNDFKRGISFSTNEQVFDSAWTSCIKFDADFKGATPSNDTDEWAVGMKLEALDRKNPTMIAVATVTDVDGDNVSITFDNWGNSFDYTTDKANGNLHPIGFAMFSKHPQIMYKPYNYSGGFNWKKYLLETNSVPVPYESFARIQTLGMPKDFYDKMITSDVIQPGS